MDLDNDTLPMENRTGLQYEFSEKIYLATSVVKEFDYPFSIHLAILYKSFEILTIMSGFQTEPDIFSAGIELQLFNFNFDYALKNHQILKSTHYFSISYEI